METPVASHSSAPAIQLNKELFVINTLHAFINFITQLFNTKTYIKIPVKTINI